MSARHRWLYRNEDLNFSVRSTQCMCLPLRQLLAFRASKSRTLCARQLAVRSIEKRRNVLENILAFKFVNSLDILDNLYELPLLIQWVQFHTLCLNSIN
jgi:hypothetical protein